MKNKLKNKRRFTHTPRFLVCGFTLVEMLVAVALFTVIASFSIGAVLSIFDANRRARSSKTVVDNLNLSIENMARTVRFGNNYYCGISSNFSSVKDCAVGGTSLSITFEGNRIIYKWDGGEDDPIERSINGGSSYTDITSPETVIEYLKFYVFGTDSSPDTNQPYVIAVIEGYSGNKSTAQSRFSIQTLMSQRALDYIDI